MKKYIIMTDKHDSNYGDNFVLFWGHNRGGYTSDVSVAGRYTREEAKCIHQPSEGHYMIEEKLLGASPSSVNTNFIVLIEKGKVNEILKENGREPVFRKRRNYAD